MVLRDSLITQLKTLWSFSFESLLASIAVCVSLIEIRDTAHVVWVNTILCRLLVILYTLSTDGEICSSNRLTEQCNGLWIIYLLYLFNWTMSVAQVFGLYGLQTILVWLLLKWSVVWVPFEFPLTTADLGLRLVIIELRPSKGCRTWCDGDKICAFFGRSGYKRLSIVSNFIKMKPANGTIVN